MRDRPPASRPSAPVLRRQEQRQRSRPIRDALLRLRAASFDLTQAGRHTEANEVSDLIRRLEAST